MEFPFSLPIRWRERAFGVPGVSAVEQLTAGFALWQKPDGTRQTVIVIGGVSNGASPSLLPVPEARWGGAPETVIVDHSQAGGLGVSSVPLAVEIAGHRAMVIRIAEGFSSFVGTPFIFASLADSRKYIGLGPEETTFLLVKIAAGADLRQIRGRLREVLPHADVWSREEFSRRAQTYWLTQTGAGGSILLAAMLGFFIGIVVVSQNIYAATMERIEEFATLKAIGASRWYVIRIVWAQALACGLGGCATGLLIAYPVLRACRHSVSWIEPTWQLSVVVSGSVLIMCTIASTASIRKAISVEPGRVFRA